MTKIYFRRNKKGEIVNIPRTKNPMVFYSASAASEGGNFAVPVEVEIPEPLEPYKEVFEGYVGFPKKPEEDSVLNVSALSYDAVDMPAVYDSEHAAIDSAVEHGYEVEDSDFVARKVRVTVETID